MKNTFCILTLLLSLSLHANDASDSNVCKENCVSDDFDPVATEEVVHVERVFAPKGFDANDHIEAFAMAIKSSPCVDQPKATVEVSGNNIHVVLKATRRTSRQDTLCIDMAVPVLATIPIGPIPAGSYNITVNGQSPNPAFTSMDIELSSNSSIDNFLYAAVDHIKVDKDNRVMTLSGENPSPCITLDKIDVISNNKDVYAILPIMKKIDAICPQVITPFEYSFALPNELSGEVLAHVRTLDGGSKNKVIKAQ
jgi:hypothetical protein